jgi:hypothetical protein
MPEHVFKHSHPLVRLRKYIRHRKYIRNTLYRRYTLSNRGYTPLSFKTRYLNFSFDEKKRIAYFRSIYSRRIGRIYHINGKDWRFDFSSCQAPEEIIDLSKSLDPSDVCAVFSDDREGNNRKLWYVYPFKRTNDRGYRGYIRETSTIFYPGLYYCRGEWMWLNDFYNRLNGIIGRELDYIRTTDYTINYNTHFIYNETLLENCEYFIYIPFNSIKTTVLQAYIPLSKSPIYIDNYYKGDTPRNTYLLTSDIFWMGRPIQLFGWQEIGSQGVVQPRIYMNRTLQPIGDEYSDSDYNFIKEKLIATIYHNTIPIDSTFHHLRRNTFWRD